MRKKKDNGLKAIICLAVATIVVGGASIALSQGDQTPDVITQTPDNVVTGDGGNSQGATYDGTALSLEGANEKIKAAYQNADGTYTVIVAKNGYIGEMVIEAVYSADGQTLISYNVTEHTETDGIGTKVNEDAYKAVLAGVKLPVTANGIDVAAILGVEQAPVEETAENGYVDGTYSAQTTPDDKGNYSVVTVTVVGGKVTNVVWDEMYGGEFKSVLSKEGKYVMKPVWATQAESLGKYVVENQTTEGILNENGYTDTVSGVSIYVGGFVAQANEAIAQANGADGTYEVKSEADDKGNYSVVTVTVEGGKIANVVWDEMYNGEFKSVLSKEGKYVMKPVWATQAESLGKYVVENQTTAGILNENGYTDTVSGVSIYVGGFVDLANQAISQAAVTGEVPGRVEAPVVDATEVDVVSGATFSSRAVIRAIDEGFVFLRDCVLNK